VPNGDVCLDTAYKSTKKTEDKGAKRLSTHQGEDAVSDGHQSSVSIQSIQDSLGIVKKNHYNQMAGERANTVSHLKKAESMEGEAASSEEIWKETGWMRGPDHKWRFEIPDHLDQFNARK
jgi:hypothetical protein